MSTATQAPRKVCRSKACLWSGHTVHTELTNCLVCGRTLDKAGSVFDANWADLFFGPKP